MTYQSAHSGVWLGMSVMENLEFIARSYRLNRDHTRERIESLLTQADLTEARQRIGARLSGGMRQKLGAIMAILPAPRLLLLDEPTTGVDPESRATLWNLIRAAANDGAIVVVSTTYLDEAAKADQVFVLSHGEILAQGSPHEVIARTPGIITATDANNHLVNTEEDDDRVWQRGNTSYTWQADIAKTPEDALTTDQLDLELSTIALLLEQGRTAPTVLPHISVTYPRGHNLIHVQGVSKAFGQFTALNHVDLEVKSGEILGLIGGNGAGKSTLIRLILGLDQPGNGNISVFGQTPNRRTRAKLGYVPQSLGLYPILSPQANYQFTTSIYGADAPDLQLEEHRATGTLPLGAQRNLAVTCALAHQPQLLILDEPTSGMDALSRARLWKTLRRAAQAGIGILITTHYQDEARQCDRLIHLEHGEVVA
ncbi:ATP-binding cassette domain-containing protein [Schaalia sp. ZJ1691]|uniref:ATP-binding cassette domain-containing protein n=1 Tax=Schaalia sp. ZJ1691 TaxID=2709404 RepID=UPI0013ED0FA0|nr:ATP-binding cassette domain-containing protein [Schaalia sp. ZJ1691]